VDGIGWKDLRKLLLILLIHYRPSDIFSQSIEFSSSRKISSTVDTDSCRSAENDEGSNWVWLSIRLYLGHSSLAGWWNNWECLVWTQWKTRSGMEFRHESQHELYPNREESSYLRRLSWVSIFLLSPSFQFLFLLLHRSVHKTDCTRSTMRYHDPWYQSDPSYWQEWTMFMSWLFLE
jgi:hypothetical protein